MIPAEIRISIPLLTMPMASPSEEIRIASSEALSTGATVCRTSIASGPMAPVVRIRFPE